jgi:hypothetical protein
MVEFVLASAVIFLVMVAWLYVQDLYRRFARYHPELGPFRSEGSCDGSCSCRQGSCPAPDSTGREIEVTTDLLPAKRSQER